MVVDDMSFLEAKYDVCMLTSRHPLKDHRVYFKEAISLKNRLDLNILILSISNDETKTIKEDGVTFHTIQGNQKDILRSVSRIRKITKKVKANIFHIHDFELLMLIPLLRRKKAKIIYDVHEDYSFMIKDILGLPKIIAQVISFIARLYEGFFSRLVNQVILVIDIHKKKFVGSYRVKKSKVIVVKNFAAIANFEKHRNQKKKYDFVYTGTTNRTRYLYEIVDFIAEKQSKKKILFILAGRPNEREELKEYIKKRNVIKQFTIKECVSFSDVPKLVAQSRIGFTLTKRNNLYRVGITTKILEYAAAGLPSISTDDNLFRRKFILENNCGVLIDKVNSDKLNDAYLEIEKNEILFGKNALLASKKMCWENEEKKLIVAYKRLLK